MVHLQETLFYRSVNKNILINENSPVLKKNNISKIDNEIIVLGKSKISAETNTKKFCKENKISYSIGRFFTFIGPFMPMNVHYAIGNFILSNFKNKSIVLNSTGQSTRSYMYISDCVAYFFLLLLSTNSNGVYNIGSEEKTTILNLAKKVNNRNDIIIKTENNIKRYYVPNTKKIQKKFVKFKTVKLNDAIIRTFTHVKMNKKLYL